jgi:hypothetical protein
VDTHRIEILDRADDDAVAGDVDHHLELVLLPAFEEALDQHLADRAHSKAAAGECLELLPLARDAATGAAECKCRPHDGRQADTVELIGRRDDTTLGNGNARGRDSRAECEPVLCAMNRVDVGADQLDSEAGQHARFGELDGQIQRGLPTERRKQRIGTFAFDHLRDRVCVERLEIGRVGPFGVGHDRRRIGVDEHDPVALAPQHSARLRSGIVEFAPLPDPNRAGADDQDRAKVGALRHVPAISSKKGSASSGPGAASG